MEYTLSIMRNSVLYLGLWNNQYDLVCKDSLEVKLVNVSNEVNFQNA